MKKTIRAFALLLCLALLCALSACADQGDTAVAPADAASLAGEYSFFCARFSPAYLAALFDYDGELPDVGEQYVLIPQMEGQTVTLDPGGKGSLDWGEDNRGPISQWSAEGDSVEIFGAHLPVTVLSDVMDTIPYEVLTSVSNRVKRVYYQD